jgi:hypothetical protein
MAPIGDRELTHERPVGTINRAPGALNRGFP